MEQTKLYFASDYQEGAHPQIMRRLEETNLVHTPGYGTDDYTNAAREKIRQACNCPMAEVEFLVGGTHTVIRFATSWATTEEDTTRLIQIIREIA
ncbi:threonine aldolase [Lachnospiraceae bacterium NK3A20]|nr:threonine aldolase [Lachnospiraceae bacterium NK3A20]